MEKINFTEKELKILHSILNKEKNGIKRLSNETIFGKDALENYYKDLNNIQVKIEDIDAQLKIEKVKKEKILILVVTNTVEKAKMKLRYSIEGIRNHIEDLSSQVDLKVKYSESFNRIDIEVGNDDKIEEIVIKIIGANKAYDGIRADAIFIDYESFFNKGLIYNEKILKQINGLKKNLKCTIINSKYYKKDLPKLVKVLLELILW